jgi:phosphoglycerate dehydrogenase-like enzyme
VGNDKLDYVIENSDYLVVCLALTKDTKHFIKEENLKKAKKNMVLVNIGRGALIDEDALIRCLENGTIAGAALDVFTVEPLPETSKIWDLPNVIVSAHNADYTNDSRKSSVRFFTELCPRFLKGEEFEGCVVDKTSGY